jgi:urea transporter
MDNIIAVLVITVAIATALNVVLKRFGVPTVIGCNDADADFLLASSIFVFNCRSCGLHSQHYHEY